MEILFVSHKYPPLVGGMEKQSFELINGMKQHAKVHLIVYDGHGSVFRFFLSLNRRILEVCRKNPGISIIHFNDGLCVALCRLHRGYKHLKHTATLHGLDVVYPNIIYQRFILRLFNRLDLIFAVSKATAKACIARGIMPEKIVVVNNGVDTKIGTLEHTHAIYNKIANNFTNKRMLVALGRPVKRKGISWFIQHVLPLLDDSFVLLIIGPYNKHPSLLAKILRFTPSFFRRQIELLIGFPSDEAKIKELLNNKEVRKRVQHLGKLPSGDMFSILSHANAFIMPNIKVEGDMEGFGLVCLEASLCGTNS